MTLQEILSVINGEAISGTVDPDAVVDRACAADLMSDVLAFTDADARSLLLTGLTNPQVIRTAEMAGVKAIVFVRGKLPPPETVFLAKQENIALMASRYTMYETCGRLCAAGLPSCGLSDLSTRTWRDAFGDNVAGSPVADK